MIKLNSVFAKENTHNAKVGKDNLIKKSRMLALKIVMSKFILIEDSDKLDKLLNLDNSMLFEESLKINSESITNKDYSAKIEFKFNAKKIWNFLAQNEINFLENKLSDNIVIIDTSMLESQDDILALVSSFNVKNSYLSQSFYYDNAIVDVSDVKFLEDIRKKHKSRYVYKVKIIHHDEKYEVYVLNLLNNNELNAQDIENIDLAIYKAHMMIEEEEKQEKIKSFNDKFASDLLSFNHRDFKKWIEVQTKLSKITGLVIEYLEIKDDSIYFRINYKGDYDNLLDILHNNCIDINKKNNSLFVMNKCQYSN
jgi:hypothetical protein